MREILFRGRRIDNGEWVEGYYAKAKHIISEKEVHVIFHTDLTLFPHSEFSSYEEVIPETLGQYTGLKDKNGRRIFEGDIVKRCFTLTRGENKKTRETQVGIVRYKNSECGFCLDNACNLCRPWPGDSLEVIGNIHDNGELIHEK